MSESTLSTSTSLETQVLGYLLNFKFYDERVKNIITRDMEHMDRKYGLGKTVNICKK